MGEVPKVVIVISVLLMLGSAVTIGIGIFIFLFFSDVISISFIIWGICGSYIGYSLWKLKRWARVASIILIILGIVGEFFVVAQGNPMGILLIIFWGIMVSFLLFSNDVEKAFRKDESDYYREEYDKKPLAKYSDYKFFKRK